jgi:hypothetical protein
MDMASQSKDRKISKLAFIALGLSLIVHVAISPCLALGLPNLSSQKKTALQYEVYSKLSNGAGPETNDLQKQEATLDKTPAKPVDLSPVTMDEGSKSDTSLGPSEEGVFKVTVKKQNVMTSGPIEQANILAPTSIKQSAGEKVLKPGGSIADKAKQVNVLPLALMPSADEEQNKDDVRLNAEKLELADLWDSTLARSQDIQFVVQKLMPNSNSGKTANVMMKMLSATVFGGMSMMTMMAPNMGAQMGSNMGAGMMMQALNGVQGNADKKARLNQTEAIMLYNMVRTTSEKVVAAFRDYKSNANYLKKANSDLTDLQEMIKETRSTQDAAKQIEMQYTLKKAQRDADKAAEDVGRYRQTLVDLSGADAVAKLDKQFEADEARINEAAIAPVQVATPDPSATAAGPIQMAAPDGAVPN